MRSTPVRVLVFLSLAFAGSSCLMQGQDDGTDAEIQGTSLGTFAVQGILLENTCGPSAFGSTDKWDFNIVLSRDGNYLYWYTGEDRVQGTIGADGATFAFSTTVTGLISDPTAAKKGCTLARADAMSGALVGSGTAISGFSGKMTYQFSQTTGSDCAEAAAEQGVIALPCWMTYSLKAAKQ